MDGHMFDDLWKGFVILLVIAFMLGIGATFVFKWLFLHLHIFWK
jgi:hypothetical protein